jgi:hypothetical protein
MDDSPKLVLEPEPQPRVELADEQAQSTVAAIIQQATHPRQITSGSHRSEGLTSFDE